MLREVIRYDHDGRLNVFNEPPLDLEGNEIPHGPDKCEGCRRFDSGIEVCHTKDGLRHLCQRCWEKEAPHD